MLIALALAAATQTVAPPPQVTRRNGNSPCIQEGLEHAGVIYRHGDRPVELRRLDELPDADMILTVLKRDERGCPIIDVVRRGVSTPETPPTVGVPLQRAPSLPSGLGPKRRPQRQR